MSLTRRELVMGAAALSSAAALDLTAPRCLVAETKNQGLLGVSTKERKNRMNTTQTQKIADRYAAVWNETDTTARRQAIVALWSADGVHYVKDLEARGYEALEQRIASSHEKNVRIGGHYFRLVNNVKSLRNVVTFNWEMVHSASGQVAATGLEFLILDNGGRIAADYQFVEA